MAKPLDGKKPKNNKLDDEIEEIDEDELYQQEKIYISSLTPPVKPVAPEKKYYHVPFNSDKPCTHIKFPFEDQRRRHYNSILLLKIYNILVGSLYNLVDTFFVSKNFLYKTCFELRVSFCRIILSLVEYL